MANKLKITPRIDAACISPAMEYSIMRIDKGLVFAVPTRMIVSMSRTAPINTMAKTLTSTGEISGTTIRRKL